MGRAGRTPLFRGSQMTVTGRAFILAVSGVLAISRRAPAQDAKVTQEEKVYVGTAFEAPSTL